MRKRERLKQWLADASLARVDLAAQRQLAAALAPISRAYLRKLLRESGVPLDVLVEGVRQESLEEAERTLCALALAYESEPVLARRIVVEAKDHARLALRREPSEDVRARRQEIVEWMVVWVHNPGLFPAWVKARRQAMAAVRSIPPG